MNKISKSHYSLKDYLRFILPSLLGILILMVPFSINGRTTIFVGLLADIINNAFEKFLPGLIILIMLLTFILTLIFKLFSPLSLKRNKFLKNLLDVNWIWFCIRFIGFILGFLSLFKLGPEFIWSESAGGMILFDLLPNLFTIFFFAGIFLPLITEFGLLEYVGVLFTPLMRPLFKLPGRSAIDCISSWIGDGTIGVTLTNQQYLRGYYTEKEAGIIATTFSAVSITFSLMVLRQVNLEHLFGPYYLTIIFVGIICAIIMPRIPPLSRKSNTYYNNLSLDIGESIPKNYTNHQWAVHLAIDRARKNNNIKPIILNGIKSAIDLWMGVLPVIMAFGTISVIIANKTSFFEILGYPFIPILTFFELPYALEASQTIMIGFSDMFLPSVLASTIPSDITRFVIATLSVTQLVYLSEAGAVILGTKIPISLFDLFIIFIERTLISLPIIIIIAKFLF